MYSGKYFILLVLLLVTATLAAHGHALGDGLFLDDHWHVLRLAESDWSRSAFFDATTIAPDRFMHMWWQEKAISWWYIRPVAILLAKIVYHLSGASVKSLHAVSLLLHLLNAVMVHHLVLRMTRRRFWAVVAALLLIVYSHSVYAVPWLASQNAILSTTFMLAALILYVRASGLNIYAGPGDASTSDGHAAFVGDRQDTGPTSMHRWAAVGVLLLWSAALLSRESAIVLPFFLAAFDLTFAGWRRVRARIGFYAILAALAVGFLAWRVLFFSHPMPDFYCQKPPRPGYALWWLTKLLHYMTATVWLSPMTVGPTGRINPFSEVPGDCVLMLIILGIMGVGYHMSCRRVRGFWIWPTWILFGLLPVVPIMATPHNGYLPSVGFAIGMVLGPALRHETKPTSVGRWCAGVAIWFLIATTTYVPIYRPMWYSMIAAERMTIAQVMRMPPGPKVTDVFFINLPFVNIYATYHIDEAMGKGARLGVKQQAEPTYRTHTLTYAPDLLRVEDDCHVRQIDAYRFRVVSDEPWFSGTLGRFLIEAMRTEPRQFKAGEVVHGEMFDVTVARVAADGVHELEFAFHEPLANPRFAFYVGTPDCAAARLRFTDESTHAAPSTASAFTPADVAAAAERLRSGDAASADVLFVAAGGENPAARTAARREIDALCLPVARALAAPFAGSLTPDGLSSWEDTRRWWAGHVDAAAIKALTTCREDFAELRWQRDALFRIRQIASWVIRTDLYLTGPPFPGPR